MKLRIRITQEVGYIVGRAMEGSGRFVRLGQLVLFSTAGGDAWLLDPEDGIALPLARAGGTLLIGADSRTCHALPCGIDLPTDS